jgi:hypothetical protein
MPRRGRRKPSAVVLELPHNGLPVFDPSEAAATLGVGRGPRAHLKIPDGPDDPLWEQHRAVFTDLYWKEDLALETIIKVMEERHSFRATYVTTGNTYSRYWEANDPAVRGNTRAS